MWEMFYDRLAPVIINFARRRGCDELMAEDVLQETFLSVIKALPEFKLDRGKGQFLSFLFKVTEYKVIDAFRRHGKEMLISRADAIGGKLRDEIISNSDSREIWYETWEKHLLGEAMNRVKERLEPMTYQCFDMVFIKGMKVAKVAEKLHISPKLVSQHKYKTYNSIIAEAKKIRAEYD